jgi:hypothetical protein
MQNESRATHSAVMPGPDPGIHDEAPQRTNLT